MPTRSILQPFLYKQAFMTAARLMILHKFYEPQCRVLVSPPPQPHPTPPHPPHSRQNERTAFSTGSLFFGSFILFRLAFLSPDQSVLQPRAALKSLTEIECLHSFNQRNARTLTEGANSSGLAGKEPLPLSLSYARKVWSAGVGICQALAVKGSL